MDDPRWLADEMLGRLARYLRFVGCDTEYARGEADDRIRARALREGRILVTRDRRLGAATPGAVVLRAVTIERQWRELRVACPDLPTSVRFDRCSLCNGRLRPAASEPGAPPRPGPDGTIVPTFACDRCGHRYWEGSHTAGIRRRIAAWSRPEAP
ncbi:MAG TPA: Mut7-C RNAse domain-containing protein [Thermoplasmata archaeon]|nr:Mut7-C RNAse domain-containing protein [Thermoplasmata archaeon]